MRSCAGSAASGARFAAAVSPVVAGPRWLLWAGLDARALRGAESERTLVRPVLLASSGERRSRLRRGGAQVLSQQLKTPLHGQEQASRTA